jgi:hypothetical protein
MNVLSLQSRYLEDDIVISSVIDQIFQLFSITRDRSTEYVLAKLPSDEINKHVMNAETIETVTFLDPERKLSDYAFAKMVQYF